MFWYTDFLRAGQIFCKTEFMIVQMVWLHLFRFSCSDRVILRKKMAHGSELNKGKRKIKCIVFSKLFNDIFRSLLNTNYSFSVSLCSPKCFKDILMCCNVIIKILAHATTNLEFHQMHSQN